MADAWLGRPEAALWRIGGAAQGVHVLRLGPVPNPVLEAAMLRATVRQKR
jgi:hypothetical protein